MNALEGQVQAFIHFRMVLLGHRHVKRKIPNARGRKMKIMKSASVI